MALRVRDVDFGKRTIRVEGSFSGGELTPPKSGKPRSVPMVSEVERTLAELLTERGNPDPDDLIFPGQHGGYLDASALRRRYVAAQEKAVRKRLASVWLPHGAVSYRLQHRQCARSGFTPAGGGTGRNTMTVWVALPCRRSWVRVPSSALL